MKSLLAIAGVLFLGLNSLVVHAEPAAAPETELGGEVRHITPQGIVIKGTIEAPGETWDGVYILIGYPKQSTAATGDSLPRIVGRRVANIQAGSATLRAYQFIRPGTLLSPPRQTQSTAAPGRQPWKPAGTSLDKPAR